MIETNLEVLKINRLTKAQYKKALSEGLIKDDELYITPEEEMPDLSIYATKDYVDKNSGKIDSIKLNGSPLPIVNKVVDIIIDIPKISLGETSSSAYPGNKGKANADAIAAHIADKAAHKDTIYTHPGTHPANMIIFSGTNIGDSDASVQETLDAIYQQYGLHVTNSDPSSPDALHVTAAEKSKWNAIDVSNFYTKTQSDGKYINLSGAQTIAGAKTFSAAVQVNNNITATGTITGSKVYGAVWNDYAEWFEKENNREKFKPGDICVWAGSGVEKSKFTKDARVVGVVSDTYGYIVGGEHLTDMEENHKKFVPICLKGRVRCNVKGPVNVGDLIITSNTEGVGQVDNTCNNQTLVGKALESSNEDGIKSILILV